MNDNNEWFVLIGMVAGVAVMLVVYEALQLALGASTLHRHSGTVIVIGVAAWVFGFIVGAGTWR